MKSLKKLIPTIIRTYKSILGIKIPESPEEHERRVNEIIQRRELEAKIKAHYERARNMMTKKGTLKFSEYKEAENTAIEILGAENAKSIILENDKAHLILFHLGKNPSKAKKLESAFRVDALNGLKKASEIYKKLLPPPNRSRAANPETRIRGGVHGAFGFQRNKAKLEAEVKLRNLDEKTGKPEKRVQVLRDITSNMLESAEKYSANKTLDDMYPSIPLRRDEWSEAIIEVLRDYNKEHGRWPTPSQAWATAWNAPPVDYAISTHQDRAENSLLMGGKKLSKQSFKKRLKNWEKISN